MPREVTVVGVYRLNQARALVYDITPRYVFWIDGDAKSTFPSAYHKTPAWFFSRHAAKIAVPRELPAGAKLAHLLISH